MNPNPSIAGDDSSRVPRPVGAVLPQVAGVPAGAGRRTPQEVLSGVQVASCVLQEFRPLTQSIEWELGHLHWARAGLFTFAENEVPFVVNNSGRLSEDAAALLFHNCVEASPQGPIHVLELGAGCGLFARYFLQAFNQLCEQEGRDFHRRLVYFVTDGSERTLAQWRERGIFDEFGAQAVAARCDATRLQEIELPDGGRRPLPELHAVFCNYVLDVLPASVVRRRAGGPVQELHVRTRLTEDKELLQRTTRLAPAEIKALLASQDPAQRALLLPLSNLFEYEVDFFPASGELPAIVEEALDMAPPADRLLVNHGAFQALRALQRRLSPMGFVLVNDYGASTPEAAAESAAPQRFGRTSAIGLNFPLLGQLFEREGWRVAVAPGDDTRAIHARLLVRDTAPRTVSAFVNRFSADAQQFFESPSKDARDHIKAGRQDAALESYRLAIARNARDWRLLGEVAEFVGLQLRDFESGIALARSALELNPWLSSWLWNILGDCVYCLERYDEAHDAYEQARRIDPRDPRTQLNLAYVWQQFADPVQALSAVAQGLAHDETGSYAARLLDKQQHILAQMNARRVGERQRALERTARLHAPSPD